jgi:hypothetical protein
MMPGCANGPCDNSKRRGGRGCYLCDVVALLPQPKLRAHRADHDVLAEQAEVPEGAEPPAVPIARPAAAPPKPRRKVAQTGSLL